MNAEEAGKLAEELVKLEVEHKELQAKIKRIKGELLEFTDLENLNDQSWSADNGYVEITTKTTYRLAEVPADFKISTEVAAIDVAEKAFKSKVTLSKEGKKMFKEQHPSIVKLMIPKIKKGIRVVV